MISERGERSTGAYSEGMMQDVHVPKAYSARRSLTPPFLPLSPVPPPLLSPSPEFSNLFACIFKPPCLNFHSVQRPVELAAAVNDRLANGTFVEHRQLHRNLRGSNEEMPAVCIKKRPYLFF